MRRTILGLAVAGLLVGGAQGGAGAFTGVQNTNAAPAFVAVDPGGIDFGDQVARQASEPRRVTITNSGGTKLYVNSVVLTGDNAEDFALAGDTCTGTTLAPGKSCVVDVVMTPTATGPRTAALQINNDAGGPETVTLTGTGINSAAVPPRARR